MKQPSPLIILTWLPLALAGCSKSSSDLAPSPKTNSVTQVGNYQDRLAAVIKRSTNAVPLKDDDKEVVLPGRRMSEHQVVEQVWSQLPKSSGGYRCEFKDGIWEILEVQKDVWGVSSTTTTADSKIRIESTNATRVVLRVRDVDGKVEPTKSP